MPIKRIELFYVNNSSILYSMKIKEQTRNLAAGCTWVLQGDSDVGGIWFSKSISSISEKKNLAMQDSFSVWLK